MRWRPWEAPQATASLRELLGWDEPAYEAVKGALEASGELVTDRGRGATPHLITQGGRS